MLIDIAMAIGQLILWFLFIGVVLIIVYQLNRSPAQRQFDEEQKAIHKRRKARKTTKRQSNTKIAKLLYFVKFKASCYSCHKNIDHTGPRKCPVCEAVFEGGGWKGFKKHWIDEHVDNQSYDNLMKYMCLDHKNKEKAKS